MWGRNGSCLATWGRNREKQARRRTVHQKTSCHCWRHAICALLLAQTGLSDYYTPRARRQFQFTAQLGTGHITNPPPVTRRLANAPLIPRCSILCPRSHEASLRLRAGTVHPVRIFFPLCTHTHKSQWQNPTTSTPLPAPNRCPIRSALPALPAPLCCDGLSP